MTDIDVAELPQLDVIFDQPKLDIDKHDWIQSGYTIIDQCCGGMGINIPSGKLLIKKDGRYDLIDEQRSK